MRSSHCDIAKYWLAKFKYLTFISCISERYGLSRPEGIAVKTSYFDKFQLIEKMRTLLTAQFKGNLLCYATSVF